MPASFIRINAFNRRGFTFIVVLLLIETLLDFIQYKVKISNQSLDFCRMGEKYENQSIVFDCLVSKIEKQRVDFDKMK